MLPSFPPANRISGVEASELMLQVHSCRIFLHFPDTISQIYSSHSLLTITLIVESAPALTRYPFHIFRQRIRCVCPSIVLTQLPVETSQIFLIQERKSIL